MDNENFNDFPSEENPLIQKLTESKTTEEANNHLDAMLQSAFKNSGEESFSQIENCVNVLGNPDIDFEISELIVSRLLDEFYPIARVSNKVIEKNRIAKVANTFGKIFIEHTSNSSLKNKCKEAFIQTITLNEKNI